MFSLIFTVRAELWSQTVWDWSCGPTDKGTRDWTSAALERGLRLIPDQTAGTLLKRGKTAYQTVRCVTSYANYGSAHVPPT
jgi:hypothetical protein